MLAVPCPRAARRPLRAVDRRRAGTGRADPEAPHGADLRCPRRRRDHPGRDRASEDAGSVEWPSRDRPRHVGRSGGSRTCRWLKAVLSPQRIPRLILEARRVAAPPSSTACTAGGAPAPAKISGSIGALSPAKPPRGRRLAALGARRSSLCARAGMGSRAYGVDVARPLAVDGVRLPARSGDQVRPRADHRVRARGNSGRRRRTRRHSRPAAAVRQPQRASTRSRRRSCMTTASAPACRRPSRRRRCPKSIVLSDLWSPIEAVIQTSSRNCRRAAPAAHFVQIVDPVEETFPYSGRVEFVEPEGAGTGHRRARRNLAQRLLARVAQHRAAEIRAETDQLGWLFIAPPHRSPPRAELLLSLHAGVPAATRDRGSRLNRPQRERREPHDDGLAARLRATAGAARASSSLPVLWWLLRLVPPRPRAHRVSADAPAVRHRAEGRDAVAHAMVAHPAAPALGRGAGDPRRRRAVVESADRDLAATKVPLAILIDDGWSAAATWEHAASRPHGRDLIAAPTATAAAWR